MQKLPVEVHEAAELFPMLEGEEYERLKADIKEHGVQADMIFYDGKLIDGRNRYRACMELGINPDHYSGELDVDLIDDPVALVLSLNLHRRHLSTSQRAMIAGKIAKLRDGRPPKEETAQNCAVSKTEAASQLKVGKGTVDSAKRVIRDGHPDVVKAVERDEIKVSQAEKLVKVVPDKEKQAKVVEGGKKSVADAVKQAPKPKPVGPPNATKPKESTTPKRARKRIPEVVIAFRNSESRMSDLRELIDELDPHEKSIVKEWLI